MKKHYETHVEDTDKLISVAGPVLDYKSWYEQYRKLMEEQAQRKYGLYTPTSEGDDDFPSIPGMIARYSASGLTNEQMAANPVWVDKAGNGHDLQLKNFAWGGMSGVGGYVEDYSIWVKSAVRADITFTDHSFNVTSVKVNQAQFYYQSSGGEQPFTVPSCTVIVKGLTDGQVLEYIYTDIEGRHVFTVKNDGIYTLPSFEFIAKGTYYGFQFNKVQESCNITIEQFPLYPGALVFDGVDDYGVCDNFPILTKEKGYTVVALRQWITRGKIAQGLVSNVKNWLNNGAFLLEYRNIQADHLNKPISFGAIGSEMDLPHILTYQTSKSYNGVSITTGNFEGTDVLHVGKLVPTNVGTCINAAIWELVFLDHDATEEELTKIKDYFVKTYPWLFPDQAWTVVGKTNEDEDRATIANITGNGNDLVCLNLGFIEGSGYNEEGEYAGYLVTDGVDDKVTSVNAVTLNKDFTVVGEWRFKETEIRSNCGIVVERVLFVYNIPTGIRIYIHEVGGNFTELQNIKSLKAICSNGIVYDENWNPISVKVGSLEEYSNKLLLGYLSNLFTQIAFKNMSIYSNQVLSKDDCIKAYNYLQTLKAK